MIEPFRRYYHDAMARLRRIERREARELRRWLEHTSNLVHVSVLVFVPLLIGVVTYLSNHAAGISFLLFPPLASGTYTLFADPEGKYAEPSTFVGGMTLGALAGWFALEASARLWYNVPPGRFQVHAGAAALGIFLTAGLAWGLDLEEPTAFSTALLVLLFGSNGTVTVAGVAVSDSSLYVVGVAASSALVAAVFSVWRERFYERRAQYLYGTTRSDDHVLVPMRGEHADAVATFGARLAAAHDAGKVVLLDVVDDAAVAEAEQQLLDRLEAADEGDDAPDREADGEPDPEELLEEAEQQAAAESVNRLEGEADRIESQVGVPCDVVVAADGGDPAAVVGQTARETNCDLIVVPYEAADGSLSPFVRSLFAGDRDVVALRTDGERTEWRRVLVPVRRAGDVAHAMIDFALRLAGASGTVGVCHCIDREARRRRAEEMLATLVETFQGRFETRVARASIEAFLERNADNYDLTIVGASTDRSAASRFVSPPTFERIQEIDCDVAVVHRP